ncbi:hypothetical protein ABZ761_33255, partial [Kitasatospora sp. NPDC006786]|uniref:hypothetical protein n=1 Tax=Kitasatospora sp. NPDC006786 TaxID=3157187 RepID=UPI0033D2EDE7
MTDPATYALPTTNRPWWLRPPRSGKDARPRNLGRASDHLFTVCPWPAGQVSPCPETDLVSDVAELTAADSG